MAAFLLPAVAPAVTDEAGFLNPALNPVTQTARESKPAPAIPWSEIGAKAGAQYQGDGLSIRPAGDGAVLRCVFQKLEGEATAQGLWLTSTVPGGAKDRFRIVAASVGRVDDSERGLLSPREMESRNSRTQRSALLSLPTTGTVEVTDNLVRFIRPGVVEEYSVSMDGVRQDFIIEGPPVGTKTSNIEHRTSNVESKTGELRVGLTVSGARVEATAHGTRLILERSGRKIAYSRLRVTDATGRELPARMEVASEGARHSCRFDAVESVWAGNFLEALETPTLKRAEARAPGLTILVNDAEAVYPVRIDPTFSDENWISMGGLPGANGDIYAAVTDGNGNLYVGGSFTMIGDVLASGIARWNGSSWSALGLGVGGLYPFVYALAASDTDLFVGGSFETAGGEAIKFIAKWDGSTWSALGSGVGHSTYSWVHALALSGSNLYAGGNFNVGTGGVADYIAKWDGSNWSSLGLGMNSTVRALAVSGTNLYAGGVFLFAGGQAVFGIAKWDGNNWFKLGSGLPGGYVYALAVSETNLYAGGDFTFPANRIAKWDGSSWSALGAGFSNTVYALAILADDLYAGGDFKTADGNTVNHVARWNGSEWSSLGSGLNGSVFALLASGGDLYAGGAFLTAGSNIANSIAKWNMNEWSVVAQAGNGLNNWVSSLAISDGDLYAGGGFTNAGGQIANRVAKWNGQSWFSLGLGMNSWVNVLAVSGSDLYAGGNFTTAGGGAASRIAKWDGSNWSALGSGFNGEVEALAISSSGLYAGGNFTTAGGSAAYRIAKWDGAVWSALGMGLNGSVNALALSGTDLYVGGTFTRATNSGSVIITVNRIAKWNGTDWSALGQGLSGTVNALAVSGSDLYAGGVFITAGGNTANRIAKWDGNTWSPLGAGLSGSVQAFAVSGSDVYAGGNFSMATNAGSTAVVVNGIAKWDGNTWSALGSGVLGGESAALAVSGVNMYVGGGFTTAGGRFSAYVARVALVLPANAVSSFPDGSDFVARFDGTPGITYTIEQTPAAAPPNWQKLTNLTAPANDMGLGVGVFELRDAVQPSGQRFYRAVYPAY